MYALCVVVIPEATNARRIYGTCTHCGMYLRIDDDVATSKIKQNKGVQVVCLITDFSWKLNNHAVKYIVWGDFNIRYYTSGTFLMLLFQAICQCEKLIQIMM